MKHKTYNYLDDYEIMDNFISYNENDESSNEFTDEQRKYQNVWKAVISQALADSVSNYKRTENKLEKIKAINWLNNYSDDFILVCDLAGYSSQYIMSRIKCFFTGSKSL